MNVAEPSFDSLDAVGIAGEKHPLRTIAQRSIAWRLGIPFNYLQKCPPDLQAEQMQYWLKHEKNDQLFFRLSPKILTEMPQVLEEVSMELGQQKIPFFASPGPDRGIYGTSIAL